MTQKRPHSASSRLARDVAASPTNASVNSLTPANGIIGASALLRLVDEASDGKLIDGAHSRSDSKLVAILGDHQHRLLGRFVAHPLGQLAGFFRSQLPIFGVIEIRFGGHGTLPFSGHIGASAQAYSRCDGKLVIIVRDLEH